LIPLTFLGTGNYFAPAGYWNSFLIGERVLVETAPSVLPNLRRSTADINAIQAIFLSHFHADHTFGWPFLLMELLVRAQRTADLWVVGPAGVEAYLAEMVRAGAMDTIVSTVRATVNDFPLHFVEVTGGMQSAGPVRFRAVQVEHAPELDCYGFLIDCEGRSVGYSGDTRYCAGLREIAGLSDVLVLECNGALAGPGGHVGLDDVRALCDEFPALPIILTHLGDAVDASGLPNVRIAADFQRLDV
jgi:ribonuclease BN (tRNA processing enzyme)